MTDSSGNQIGDTVKYLPFGETRANPDIPLDKLFTGQRLDSTGLYYYNARYYDPMIGRFISPDTVIQRMNNPQCLNRYSYVQNNPLKYTDPSGHIVDIYGSSNPIWMFGMFITSANKSTQKQVFKVLEGYKIMKSVAPEIAKALESSKKVTRFILDSSLPDSDGAFKVEEKGHTHDDHVIHLNDDLVKNTTDMAGTMGHEGFHDICNQNGFTEDSRYEEACAKSIGTKIKQESNWWPVQDWQENLNDMNPSWNVSQINRYLDTKNTNWRSYSALPALPKESFIAMQNLYVQYYPN
jgi:RHS repeat-associated protein